MKLEKVFYRIFNKTPIHIKKLSLPPNEGMANRILSKKGNIFKYKITFTDRSEISFIGKKKSFAIIMKGIYVLSGNDILLMLQLALSHRVFGFDKSWMRESAVYKNISTDLKQFIPHVYGTHESKLTKQSFVAMGEFDDTTKICKESIFQAIEAIAQLHKHYYNSKHDIRQLCLNNYVAADYRKAKRAFKKLFNKFESENMEFFGREKIQIINRFIDNIHDEFASVSFHKTLTHNDFTDRNIIIDDQKICIYDWELACWQNPEHDIIELLSTIMDRMTCEEVKSAIDYHYNLLGVSLPPETRKAILRFNVLEYCVNKLSVLRHISRKLKMEYEYKVLKNIATLMDILEINY